MEKPLEERNAAAEFARQAGEAEPGLPREVWRYVVRSGKWWLLPLLALLFLIGLLLLLGGTGAAPFIYTLF